MVEKVLDSYQEAGYLVLPHVFAGAAVDRLLAEVPALCHGPQLVCEADAVTPRSLYGSHLAHELFAALTRDPRLVEPARLLAGGDVYVYQSKINLKAAHGGDVWPWHQDLIYWQREDGLPGGDIVNLALLLDDMTAENGPLRVIPGSHRLGTVEVEARAGEPPEAYRGAPGWIDDLIADLKYSLAPGQLPAGAVDLVAPRGSVIAFHPNLMHSSARNSSSLPRRLLFVTYNRTDNLPRPAGEPRPEFLVGRDYRPLVARADPRL
jgi:L-proline 4-hydroxylase